MAETVTRTATRGTHSVREAAREVGQGVARKAVSEVGGIALKAVVDMAVSRVDGVAARLDRVAESGDTSLREALTGRPAPVRSDRKAAGTTVPARVGAAFSLVITRAMHLLQILQRMVLQLLEALRRLARRPRTSPAEPEADGADEDEPEQDVEDEHDAEAEAEADIEDEDEDEDSEPSGRRERRAWRRGRRTRRSDAPKPRSARSAPAEPAVRRSRPDPSSARGRRR